MMVVEHREDLALACEPRRLAVRELLVGVGKRHADPPQPPDDPISRGASATRAVNAARCFLSLVPIRLRSNGSPARWGGRALGILERVRRHARSVEHLARDEDRERVPKRQGDPVGGTCIDTRSALAHLHEHAGDECLATELVDLHAYDLASQLANDRLHQVMGERPRVVLFRQTELDGERLRATDRDGQRLAPGGIDENHRGTASAHRQYPAHFHLDRVGRAGSQAKYPDENHQAATAHGKPPRTLINRTRPAVLDPHPQPGCVIQARLLATPGTALPRRRRPRSPAPCAHRESEIRQIDPETGKVLTRLTMPEGTEGDRDGVGPRRSLPRRRWRERAGPGRAQATAATKALLVNLG